MALENNDNNKSTHTHSLYLQMIFFPQVLQLLLEFKLHQAQHECLII